MHCRSFWQEFKVQTKYVPIPNAHATEMSRTELIMCTGLHRTRTSCSLSLIMFAQAYRSSEDRGYEEALMCTEATQDNPIQDPPHCVLMIIALKDLWNSQTWKVLGQTSSDEFPHRYINEYAHSHIVFSILGALGIAHRFLTIFQIRLESTVEGETALFATMLSPE